MNTRAKKNDTVDPWDERLAEALKEVGYDEKIQNLARQGHWSDFKTRLAAPKMDLAQMLFDDNHLDLRKRVIDGEFDDNTAGD